MSAWRRRAIGTFPELRRELHDGQAIFSIYALWFELLSMTRDAHRAGNEDLLDRIYAYAAWCHRQGGHLENAVDVAFYEHLVDEEWMWPHFAPRIAHPIVDDVRGLSEWRLSDAQMRRLEALLLLT